MEFEDILKQCGEYGKFQKRLVYFFLIPVTTIFSILCMNTFFMLSEPDHWCMVPEIQNLTTQEQHLLSRKPIPDSNKLDSCSFYDLNYDYEVERLNAFKTAHQNSSDRYEPYRHANLTTTPCNSWTFDHSNYDSNAVIDLNLVCDKKHWKNLIQTLHGVGEVAGNPLFGFLSDVFGRHIVLFSVILCAILSSFSPVLYTGLIVFTICRFMNSFTSATLFTLPYILVTELVGPDHRTRIIGVASCCWTLGMCLLAGFAYIARDWIRMAYVPTLAALPLFAMWNIIPESPRWLLSKGRYSDAYDVMANIARVNGKAVPEDLMQQLIFLNRQKEKTARSASITSASKSHKSPEEVAASMPTTSGTFLDMFKYPGLRKKFFLLLFCWTANVCAYRGLTLNFENFHGNEFLNWFLLGVVEFPSNMGSWVLMESRLGRRWTNSLSAFAGGVALCMPVFIPASFESWVIYVSLVGKFLTNMAYNVVYQQTVELFPTPIRNQVMSYTTAFAAGANFALPYLASLGKIHVWIPLMVMGLMSIASAIANFFLPETLHENLPQTFQDGDVFGEDMSFFSLAKSKRPEGEAAAAEATDLTSVSTLLNPGSADKTSHRQDPQLQERGNNNYHEEQEAISRDSDR